MPKPWVESCNYFVHSEIGFNMRHRRTVQDVGHCCLFECCNRVTLPEPFLQLH